MVSRPHGWGPIGHWCPIRADTGVLSTIPPLFPPSGGLAALSTEERPVRWETKSPETTSVATARRTVLTVTPQSSASLAWEIRARPERASSESASTSPTSRSVGVRAAARMRRWSAKVSVHGRSLVMLAGAGCCCLRAWPRPCAPRLRAPTQPVAAARELFLVSPGLAGARPASEECADHLGNPSLQCIQHGTAGVRGDRRACDAGRLR